MSTSNGRVNSDEAESVLDPPPNAPFRDATLRERSFTNSSQRSFGATTPQSVQESLPSRPSFEHGAVRRPSFSYSQRQPSHTPDTSISRPHGSTTSFTSMSRNAGGYDTSSPTGKAMARTREGSYGIQLNGDSPEAGTALRKVSTNDSSMSSDSRVTVTPVLNTTARGESGSHDRLGGELRIPPRSRRPSHQEGFQNVGDFALEHLFGSFVTHADQLIRQCATPKSAFSEPRIAHICGPGADSKFDQILSALGYIARKRPGPLIERVLQWGRRHKESITSYSSQSGHSKPLPKPNGEVNGSSVDSNRPFSPNPFPLANQGNNYTKAPTNAADMASADRRSSAVSYVLCRALMEIFAQASLSAITPESAQKLEGIIYDGQVRLVLRDPLDKEPMKLDKWEIATRLLGVMAGVDLDGVTSHFIRDLRHFQKELTIKGNTNKTTEAEAVFLLKSMRHIKLNLSSDEDRRKSTSLLLTISELFAGVHGQAVKTAYCRLFSQLFLSAAGEPAGSYDMPAWRQLATPLWDRLHTLSGKPKYWQHAFTAQTLLLSVLPTDLFLQRWRDMIAALPSKLRERQNRPAALKGACRLIWSYLSRDRDRPFTITKPLDDITKTIFFPTKRYPLSAEPHVAEPLIELIRIIGAKYQEFCFKQVIFPLMQSEIFTTHTDVKDLKIDQLDPDRMVIGVRAFLIILSDIEQGAQPPFPAHFDDEQDEAIHQRSVSGPNSKNRASRNRSVSKVETLAKPVAVANLPDMTREFYTRFCDVIGKIAIICDNTFGGQAVLDEKFSTLTPKTPIADNLIFNRKDESASSADDRHGFYDLLHVSIQGLPRCLAPQTPLQQILNLLCTGTAHIEKDIATSSAMSLQAIAKQNHAQTVVAKFSSFILKYDNRYSTMSDGGMLGPNHIEDTLTLYVTLLKIWKEDLQQRREAHDRSPGQGGALQQLTNSSTWSQVDRVESQGLFFLCSPSPRVRAFAVEVLRLVTDLDAALGQQHERIHDILMGNSASVFDPTDERYSLAERSRLEKAMASGNTSTILVELCSSTSDLDISLWLKVFPKLVHAASSHCPMAIAQTREDVCLRISQMQSVMEIMDERPPGNPSTSMDSNSSWIVSRSVDLNIEQWKIYLMFACTTITKTGSSQQTSMESHHTRKSSKSSQTGNETVSSASELFTKVLPLLSAQTAQIRNAAVAGLGAVNFNLYKTLLESLEQYGKQRLDLSKKNPHTHQRGASSPRRQAYGEFFATEVAHIYQSTCYLLQIPEILSDEWILTHVSTYAKDLGGHLQNVERIDEFLRLRVYYCGLVEGLFKAVERTSEPQRWMMFQTRRAAFVLMEGWCGSAQDQAKAQPDYQQVHVQTSRRTVTAPATNAAWANELKSLRMAALNAMATLCAGPVAIRIGTGSLQFNVSRIFVWIDQLVNSDGDRLPAIGKRALKNLLIHNSAHPYLFETSIQKLFVASTSKGLESYLDAIGDIILQGQSADLPMWKMLSGLIFVLGNKHSNIRVKAARVLRFLDEQHGGKVKLQEFDISIADKTFAVNRKAQFEITSRFSKYYQEYAFFVFSEFSVHFKELASDSQRSMVEAILPWIQTVKLVVDGDKNPTADSYMLLVNMLDITIACSSNLPHEIAALWKALSTGPYGGNVQVALDFIIDISVEWRDGKIIDVARRVVVYMADTPAGQNVIEYLLQRLSPRYMWQDKRKVVPRPPEAIQRFPHVADLSIYLKDSLAKQERNMSIGQLCLIVLVDLVVAPISMSFDKIPGLLQAVLALWDQQPQVFHEPAREMLVHLIHELVISKLADSQNLEQLPHVENFIELVRKRDPKVLWAYDDNDAKDSADPPEQLAFVVPEVTKIFTLAHPEIHMALGKVAFEWATKLPVRHLACRSLQIYRCILRPLDQSIVFELLFRLSQTACDSENELQAYALELIRTIRSILTSGNSTEEESFYPQLFWAICACLSSIHELEFAEGLNTLEAFLDKFDLTHPVVLAALEEAKPADWRWAEPEPGIAALIQRGCRSGQRVDKALQMLCRLVRLPSNSVVGGDKRLLFSILAHLPMFSKSFETPQPHTLEAAAALAAGAESQRHIHLAAVLNDLANSKFTAREEFLKQILWTLKTVGNAQSRQESLIFLMGLLTNSCCWYAAETLRILDLFVAELEPSDLESNTAGPDLVSPLLRQLQTDHCTQALKVLDRLSAISGNANGKELLQMTMAGSRSSRAIRQEYERTASLFGIPEETGWSVPMPAIFKEAAKSNLNNVLGTFPHSSARVDPTFPTPELEFYKDDQTPGSYFPSATMHMTHHEVMMSATNMSELVTELDSLDDFFDTPGPISLDGSPPVSIPGSGAGTPWTLSRQTTNDTQPDFSYNTSFESNSSHQQPPSVSYSPERPSNVPRESPYMSPSAFRASPKAGNTRPGMGARSTTAAAVVQRTPPDRTFTLPPRELEPFSDDDVSSGRASSHERTIELEQTNNPRSSTTMPRRPSLKANMRSSLRRLTGGSVVEKSRSVSISAPRLAVEEPEVPRVPSVYLANNNLANPPKSHDL